MDLTLQFVPLHYKGNCMLGTELRSYIADCSRVAQERGSAQDDIACTSQFNVGLNVTVSMHRSRQGCCTIL